MLTYTCRSSLSNALGQEMLTLLIRTWGALAMFPSPPEPFRDEKAASNVLSGHSKDGLQVMDMGRWWEVPDVLPTAVRRFLLFP